MSSQLLKFCKSIPLSKLKQGGTLSIQSKLPITRIKFIPEWREDAGHLSLMQFLNNSDAEADVSVTHELDKMTSLGRSESHLSVRVFPKEPSTYASGLCTTERRSDASSETILRPVDEPLVITDDGEIQPDSEKWHASNVRRVEYSDGITHVSTRDDSSRQQQETPSLTLTAVIPEKVNISCELLEGGDIIIDKKVEGDAHLMTTDGNIHVNKLRGHEISISAKGSSNTILATDLLEAQNLIIETGGRVRAKKVHGSHVKIQVDRQEAGNTEFLPTNDVDDEGSFVDISSIYVAGNGSADLHLSSAEAPEKSAVRVKSHHGHVAVKTTVPPSRSADSPKVEFGGVNGSFDIQIHGTSAAIETQPFLAGRIHVDSLSRDSVSVFTADCGNVALTLDRKAETDLRMLSSNSITSFLSRDVLLEDGDPTSVKSALRDLHIRSERTSKESRIRIETDAFTARTNGEVYANIDYVDGWVENKSNEPDSRFDLSTKGGKIQLQGAAQQALEGFSSSDKKSEVPRPLVAIVTDGDITLESLSWFGAIARRYGLEEERDDLGRTATRRGRLLVPIE
jgi:hypothetical protein